MEREALERYLSEGQSLAEIAAVFGCDRSTVGYWVRKHGLRAAHAERHAAKGALAREQLEPLVRHGLSVREIALRLDRSPSTVRHWLRQHGLSTSHPRRAGRARGRRGADSARRALICSRHGTTEFWLEGRGIYRCLKCRSEAVSRRRRRLKEVLVAEAGGKCQLCGYDRYIGALQFHHRDSAAKSFGLGERGFTRSLEAVRAEAAKCALLCSNCHAEVEAGIVNVPLTPLSSLVARQA
jgi:transposase-like protein